MEDLKEVQHAVLGIMKDIDKVCTENHIKYWLYAGTLIGAVRHNGFIPWDDDLDVAMLREDYERFLKVAPQCLGKRYFIQTWESDPGFAPRRMTRKLYRWLQVKENGHKTKKVFDTCEPALTGKAMDANLFDHVVRHSFEDSTFYIPE